MFFKNLAKMALFALAQRWFRHASVNVGAPMHNPIHLNNDAIKALSLRIGSLVTLSLLNCLLFVGGLMTTAVAAAHSFDVYNQFIPTAVFWTGLIMIGTAFVIGGACGWALMSTKIDVQEFLVEEAPVVEGLSFRERLLSPFLEGLREGFQKPRGPSGSAHARSEPAA